ncbi:hypothetical protein LCGC14_2664750, partial [marine sediment metagenome]
MKQKPKNLKSVIIISDKLSLEQLEQLGVNEPLMVVDPDDKDSGKFGKFRRVYKTIITKRPILELL